MELYIKAHSKEIKQHTIFAQNISNEFISDGYRPCYLDGKLRCISIKSDNISVAHYKDNYTDCNGEFDPIFIMNFAARLRLNGNYRLRHIFSRSEIITMLASVIKKSELADVVRQIEGLVGD